MPAKRKPVPSYLLHKQSGRARAVWYDSEGIRREKLLPGTFNSSESRTAFARLQLEQETAPVPAVTERDRITIAELLCAFLDHAERHYRGPDGRHTSELYEVRVVIRALRELYADTPAAEFGPLALKAARQKWVNEGRSRTECNRRVGMVKRIFKWAASEELAPASVFHALVTVTGLQKGRTPAHETEPVSPVDDAVVDATLPFLGRHVRGLVEFQRLTGCRPGEACSIRRCDISMEGEVWTYRPFRHKNAWRGKDRIIAIGPKAQEVLKPFFTDKIDDYLFSPRRAVEELLAERSAKRKTPRYASHMKRNTMKRKKNPRRIPAESYSRYSYGLAIDRACDRAFPPPQPLSKIAGESDRAWRTRLMDQQKIELRRWQSDHRWHPNQLRHAFATRVRKCHGLEAAQVLLGHSKADVTQIYAANNEELARSIAADIG